MTAKADYRVTYEYKDYFGHVWANSYIIVTTSERAALNDLRQHCEANGLHLLNHEIYKIDYTTPTHGNRPGQWKKEATT